MKDLVITQADIDRFWPKVDVGDIDSCWSWKATKFRLGYGAFSVGGRLRPAHRIAALIQHGTIPDGLHVLHKCDSRDCVNPSHLYFGTHRQNMRDRMLRLRGVKKLSPGIVEEIRRSAEPQRSLADRYGVCQAMIWKIKARKCWTGVP